jgi:hypothetical protein
MPQGSDLKRPTPEGESPALPQPQLTPEEAIELRQSSQDAIKEFRKRYRKVSKDGLAN